MKRILLYITLPFVLAGCIEEDEFNNTPNGNFEALWSLIDERYCFFEQAEQEYGLNWHTVYDRYRPLADTCSSNAALFDVLGDMLAELRDGQDRKSVV